MEFYYHLLYSISGLVLSYFIFTFKQKIRLRKIALNEKNLIETAKASERISILTERTNLIIEQEKIKVLERAHEISIKEKDIALRYQEKIKLEKEIELKKLS